MGSVCHMKISVKTWSWREGEEQKILGNDTSEIQLYWSSQRFHWSTKSSPGFKALQISQLTQPIVFTNLDRSANESVLWSLEKFLIARLARIGLSVLQWMQTIEIGRITTPLKIGYYFQHGSELFSWETLHIRYYFQGKGRCLQIGPLTINWYARMAQAVIVVTLTHFSICLNCACYWSSDPVKCSLWLKFLLRYFYVTGYFEATKWCDWPACHDWEEYILLSYKSWTTAKFLRTCHHQRQPSIAILLQNCQKTSTNFFHTV